MLIDQPRKIPNGPADAFDREQDLLVWIEANFKKYGDLYRATVFGRNVYVASSPEYAQHVLRNNWENYRKGQAIKRVAILLGNGLMVSEGDFWKNQRRMIQPAFHRNAVAGLYEVMKVANLKLLEKWENSARQDETVNVTSDTSLLVLEITLRAMFGEDYPRSRRPSTSCMTSPRGACVLRKRSRIRGKSWSSSWSDGSATNQKARTFSAS